MFSLTFKDFVKIIKSHGFAVDRQNGTSHCVYKGVAGGKTRLVTVAAHRMTDHINPNTLRAMMRQSGLSKKIFRNSK